MAKKTKIWFAKNVSGLRIKGPSRKGCDGDNRSLIIEQYEKSDGLRSDKLLLIGCVKRISPFGVEVTESLILAQNERWRHGLGMQVER